MNFVVIYNVSPQDQKQAALEHSREEVKKYYKKLWAFFSSGKGICGTIGILLLALIGVRASFVFGKIGYNSESGSWRLYAVLAAVVGVAPLVYTVSLLVKHSLMMIRAIRLGTVKFNKVEFNKPMQTKLDINDSGISLSSELRQVFVGWDKLESIEVLKNFLIVANNDCWFYIPRREIPDSVHNFILSKGGEYPDKEANANKSASSLTLKHVAKLLAMGLFLTFLVGLSMTVAFLLFILIRR
jgi:hypothetical protein